MPDVSVVYDAEGHEVARETRPGVKDADGVWGIPSIVVPDEVFQRVTHAKCFIHPPPRAAETARVNVTPAQAVRLERGRNVG